MLIIENEKFYTFWHNKSVKSEAELKKTKA